MKQIKLRGKLDLFVLVDNEIDAAVAYNNWSKEKHGHFSKLNVIEGDK